MYVGNDTSHEILADNFVRNRGKNFVQPFSKKWHSQFFDSLTSLTRGEGGFTLQKAEVSGGVAAGGVAPQEAQQNEGGQQSGQPWMPPAPPEPPEPPTPPTPPPPPTPPAPPEPAVPEQEQQGRKEPPANRSGPNYPKY